MLDMDSHLWSMHRTKVNFVGFVCVDLTNKIVLFLSSSFEIKFDTCNLHTTWSVPHTPTFGASFLRSQKYGKDPFFCSFLLFIFYEHDAYLQTSIALKNALSSFPFANASWRYEILGNAYNGNANEMSQASKWWSIWNSHLWSMRHNKVNLFPKLNDVGKSMKKIQIHKRYSSK